MSKHVILVSVMMKATSEGYYKNRIVPTGEKFLYEGGLNRKGELPLWADPIEEGWEAKVEAAKAKASKAKAPVAAPAAPVVTLPDAPVAVKPLTKAELVAKLCASLGKEAAELNKMKVDELRALDAQGSLQSVM